MPARIDAEVQVNRNELNEVEQQAYDLDGKTINFDVEVSDKELTSLESRVERLDGKSIRLDIEEGKLERLDLSDEEKTIIEKVERDNSNLEDESIDSIKRDVFREYRHGDGYDDFAMDRDRQEEIAKVIKARGDRTSFDILDERLDQLTQDRRTSVGVSGGTASIGASTRDAKEEIRKLEDRISALDDSLDVTLTAKLRGEEDAERDLDNLSARRMAYIHAKLLHGDKVDQRLNEIARERDADIGTNERFNRDTDGDLDEIARNRTVQYRGDIRNGFKIDKTLDEIARDRTVKFRTTHDDDGVTGVGTGSDEDSGTTTSTDGGRELQEIDLVDYRRQSQEVNDRSDIDALHKDLAPGAIEIDYEMDEDRRRLQKTIQVNPEVAEELERKDLFDNRFKRGTVTVSADRERYNRGRANMGELIDSIPWNKDDPGNLVDTTYPDKYKDRDDFIDITPDDHPSLSGDGERRAAEEYLDIDNAVKKKVFKDESGKITRTVDVRVDREEANILDSARDKQFVEKIRDLPKEKAARMDFDFNVQSDIRDIEKEREALEEVKEARRKELSESSLGDSFRKRKEYARADLEMEYGADFDRPDVDAPDIKWGDKHKKIFSDGVADKFVDGADAIENKIKRLTPTMSKLYNIFAALLPVLVAVGAQAIGVAGAFGAIAGAGATLIAGGLLGMGDNLQDSLNKAQKKLADVKKELFDTFQPTFAQFTPFAMQWLNDLPDRLEPVADAMSRATEFEGLVDDATVGTAQLVAEAITVIADHRGDIRSIYDSMGGFTGDLITDGISWFLSEAEENTGTLKRMISMAIDLGQSIYYISESIALGLSYLMPFTELILWLSQTISGNALAAVTALVASIWLLGSTLDFVMAKMGMLLLYSGKMSLSGAISGVLGLNGAVLSLNASLATTIALISALTLGAAAIGFAGGYAIAKGGPSDAIPDVGGDDFGDGGGYGGPSGPPASGGFGGGSSTQMGGTEVNINIGEMKEDQMNRLDRVVRNINDDEKQINRKR